MRRARSTVQRDRLNRLRCGTFLHVGAGVVLARRRCFISNRKGGFYVKTIHTLLAAASLSLLAACGGQGDDTAGDAVAQQADATADAMDQQADQMDAAGNEAGAESMEAQADATREAGEQKEEAIDEADVNATTGTATDTTATPPAQ